MFSIKFLVNMNYFNYSFKYFCKLIIVIIFYNKVSYKFCFVVKFFI